MSTGGKLFFGCLALVVIGILALVVVLAVGGFALRGGIESVLGTVEDQQAATRTLQRLSEEHPFDPPADGVVSEARLGRFLTVTRDAWAEMAPWAEDLRQLDEGGREGIGRLRDVAAGTRVIGGMVRSRLALTRALDDHDSSVGEYLWTGMTLERTAEALEGGGVPDGIPEANVRLVESRAGDLPRLGDDGSGLVLAVAIIWGMSDLSTWQAMGLDTLVSR
jgi:hypothetical protein